MTPPSVPRPEVVAMLRQREKHWTLMGDKEQAALYRAALRDVEAMGALAKAQGINPYGPYEWLIAVSFKDADDANDFLRLAPPGAEP